METRKDIQLTVTIAAAVFLLALLALPALAPSQPANAGGIPTPIANLPGNSQDAVLATFLDNDTSTADAGGPAVQVFTAEYCYMQYIIDQTNGNTTTLKSQYSMDATNWVDGITLVSANTTDDSGIVQVPVYARYIRIYEDHTGSNTVTTTVKALCK
ncbi:MAG: discoidin domain-containing protein [Anaerolineae bacterium]